MDAVPELASEAPKSPHSRHNIFFGRFGFRAGWGIAIFVVIMFILMSLGQIFGVAASGQMKKIFYAQAHHIHPHIDLYPCMPMVTDSILFLGLFGMCFLFSRAERRRLSAYGVGSNRWLDVFPGAFWGVAIMSALVAVLTMTHHLVFEGRVLEGSAILAYGAKWLLAFICVGFAEEYAFRGYLQFTLMRGVWGLAERLSPANPRPLAFWIAATLLSAGFMAMHMGNGGETHFGLLAVFIAGMAFAYTLWRTGSLWWAIGFHATWDWAQSFLFGVPDSGGVSAGRLYATHPAGNPLLSGGADGPEGSVFVVAALLLAVAAVHLSRPGTQPEVEQGSLGTVLPHEENPAS